MHSSQQSPSPHLGSCESRSSSLENMIINSISNSSDIDRVGISPKQQLLCGDRMIEYVHSGFIQSAHNSPPLDQ